MSLTNLQLLRIEIVDPYKYAFDSQLGDGETAKFKLSHDKIKPDSYSIYIDDVEQTETEDFAIDLDAGMVTFVEAPDDEKEVRVEYYFSVFSDDELEAFLELDNDNVTATALRCIDIMLVDSARHFDYKAGDAELKPDQVFKHLKELREVLKKKLEGSATAPIIMDRKSSYYTSERTTDSDLSRLADE